MLIALYILDKHIYPYRRLKMYDFIAGFIFDVLAITAIYFILAGK